ncbi:MAG: hypothetical protein AABY32_03895 [Nanoarchaeota archaeon]
MKKYKSFISYFNTNNKCITIDNSIFIPEEKSYDIEKVNKSLYDLNLYSSDKFQESNNEIFSPLGYAEF